MKTTGQEILCIFQNYDKYVPKEILNTSFEFNNSKELNNIKNFLIEALILFDNNVETLKPQQTKKIKINRPRTDIQWVIEYDGLSYVRNLAMFDGEYHYSWHNDFDMSSVDNKKVLFANKVSVGKLKNINILV